MPERHHHNHKQADKWTNIAAVGEAFTCFVNDAYWLATLIDTICDFESEELGLSYYGIGFGVILGLLSAGGATYSHRALNVYHQRKQSNGNSVPEYIPASGSDTPMQTDDAESTSVYISIADTSAQPDDAEPTESKHSRLTVLQKISLAGDSISHAGDIAGPLTFVVNLAANNSLPRLGKGLLQCGATLLGGIVSVATVRTCKDAMLAQNMERNA